MADIKSKLKINIEYIFAVSIIKLVRLLPLQFLYFIARTIAPIFYKLDGKHRNRTIQHLLHSEVCKTELEAEKMAKINFLNLTKLALELFKMPQIVNPQTCRDHFTFKGSQKAIDMFFTQGQEHQGIMVTAHYGNWEILCCNFSVIFGRPITALMRLFDNPKIGEYIYQERSKDTKSELVPKEGGIRHILKALKKDHSILMLADQHAGGNAGIETTFFGHPAKTHTSPALLHLRTGIPIQVFLVRRVDDQANFEIICKDPIIFTPTDDKDKDVQEITQLMTTQLEELIGDNPEQWMWCHRRWLDINRKGYKKQQ